SLSGRAACAGAGARSSRSVATARPSALPRALARVLGDRLVQIDRGGEDAVLFGDVRGRVALARARALGAADEAEVDPLGHDLHQTREHVRTRARVARLLLHPHHLTQVGVAAD